MSTSPINDGGPAFPINDTVHANGQVQYGSNGMTLRDYFAAHIMAALINGSIAARHELHVPARVKDCWEIADAMIAARSKQ